MLITSTRNEKVKQWKKLTNKKYIYEYNEVLIEGENVVELAVKNNKVKTLIVSETYKGRITGNYNGKIYYINDMVSEKLSTVKSTKSIFAITPLLYQKITSFNKLLLLDDISDPGNLGTLIRTANAFNFDGVFITNTGVDIHNDKVIRSTQGAIFNIKIEKGNLEIFIEKLKQAGVNIISTDLKAKKNTLHNIDKSSKNALILGNEGRGVRPIISNKANVQIKIPIANIDSLNVAVAGGIIMYHFSNI